MNKKITLADVAKSLGISKTVVSLVINGKGDHHGISKETQRRVREKIDELNYTPNQLARGFRTGRTHTLGLIVSDISNHFYAQLARHIEDLAWSCGYTLVTCSTDEKVEKEVRQIELLLDRKVDGLFISSSQQSADMFNGLLQQGRAHVLIDRVFDNMLSAAVSVDNYLGGQLAAQHLIAKGSCRPAVISIEPGYISTLKQRQEGFLDAMSAQGLAVPEHYIFHAGFSETADSVGAMLEHYHLTHQMPDAFFTLNNNLTTYCLKHLVRLGYKIPDEVMIIGFDDADYFSIIQPSVSVLAQPVELIAKQAFRMLFDQIESAADNPPGRSILEVKLVARQSTLRRAPEIVLG